MKPSAEGFFLDIRNRKIHVQGWWASFEPKAVILVVHGLGEHGGRYARFAEQVNPRGFHVIALDLPGFGKSEGKRGHIDRFDEFLGCVEQAALYFKEPEFVNLPMFLFGHSMGGLIAFHAGVRFPKYFRGLVLSSPAFAFVVKVPKFKLLAGTLADRLLPKVTLPHGLDMRFLSHDPEVRREYESDPLVHDRISARLFGELLRAMRKVPELAAKCSLPVLVQIGGEDPFVNRTVIEEVLEKIPGEDKELLVYDHFYHEPYNELDRHLAYEDLERWILKHLK